jgi:Fe(3+) dicitrate transport protein
MDDRFDYDVSLFHLSYQDRIGTILRKAPNPQFNNLVDRIFRYRTNIADARIFGLESYAEMDLYKLLKDRSSSTRVSVFGNLALIRAAYAESEENGVEGNVVELVPEVNFKTGLMFRHRDFELAYQLSFLSEHFSDASNAILTPTAIEGIIPAYHVMDLSARYLFQRYRIDAGINNLLNSIYFTRRATGYPGPGILPSSGRSFYLTVGVRL